MSDSAEEQSIPTGTDAASRAKRRSWRDRLGRAETRRTVIGVLATLAGGTFWGFSGTAAKVLFDVYAVDTMWLLAVRQLLAGLLFLAVILVRDRARLIELLHNPRDLRDQALFTLLGVFGNQLFYLSAVRLTNAGTATVLQCLQLILIMAITCGRTHRLPKVREVAGLVLALAGTFLIATGGDPASLVIPPAGLAMGILAAVGMTCVALVPARILPRYGSTIVTGTGMLASGVVTCVLVRPWQQMPDLSGGGWGMLALFVVVGSFLAYLLYMQGVRDIGGMRASLIGTVEPVSATVTSAVVLGTAFAGTDIAGFAMIIAMVFLTA